MPDTETVAEQPDRGLDHGAYVPLTVMYPEADIPVLQMSMPDLDPAAPVRARAPAAAAARRGRADHGLGVPDPRAAVPPGLASRRDRRRAGREDFDLWAAEALARGDVDELMDFRSVAPGMPYAHPTVEHFAPLFVTLGAASDPEDAPDTAIEGFFLGLAKRSFAVA